MRSGWLGPMVLADVRRRAGSLALLTLLVAVGGAFVLAPVAGARRTTSALDRLRERTDASDASVQYQTTDGADVASLLRALPGVLSVGEIAVALVLPDDGDFDSSDFSYGNLSVVAVDGTFGDEVERGRIIAGEQPDPSQALEAAASRELARRFDLQPGDELPMISLSTEQLECVFSGCSLTEPEGPRLTLRITAIEQFASEAFGEGNPQQLLLTPAFAEEYLPRIASFGDLYHVRLVDGVDGVDQLRADVAALVAERDQPDDYTYVTGALDEAVGIIDASSFAARGLLLVSGLAAVALAVAFAQAAARHVAAGADDREVLRAIGVGSRAAALAGAGAVVVPVAVGSLLAAGASVLASPLFPIGQSRTAEPDPGLRADPAVALLGALGLVVGLGLVLVAVVARRRRRASRVNRTLRAGPNLPPVVAVGVGAGLRPGPGGTSPGQAVAGVAAAIALAGASLVFVTSLDRFVASPDRDGWTFDWEVAQGSDLDLEGARDDARAVAAHDGVTAVTLARISDTLEVEDLVQAYGTEPIEGAVSLAVVSGRGPAANDEVALGAETARDLGVGVGDELPARDGVDGSFRVVGIARFPLIAADRPDHGAWFTSDGLDRVAPPGSSYPTLLVDVDPTADLEVLAADLASDHPYVGTTVQTSTDAASLAQVVRLPPALAGLAATIGIAALGHALVVGTRARRRELAVLRSIGMRRREVAATVRWHSLSLVASGAVLGVPAGLVAGRLAWAALAGSVGVAADPLVPASLLLVVPAAVAVGLALAVVPARVVRHSAIVAGVGQGSRVAG